MVDVMAFVVFVGGLLEYNSGKTTVAKEIILNLEEKQSLSTVPFKPLSGNNLFYHYEQIKENLANHNQFISLDIVDLLSSSSSKVSPTIANPVHRVSTEALSYEFFKESSIKTFYSKYSNSVTLFQRFSILDSSSEEKSVFIVNEPIYKNQKFWNDLSLTDPIIKQAQDVRPFKNEQEYYSLNNQFYAEATKTTFETLTKDAQAIVIESFNNSAHPAWCIRDSNIILLVGPGSLFVYEPEAYFRAIDNFRSINRNKPTTTDDILNFATPNEAYSISIDDKEKSKDISAICQTLYDNFK
jgi:predicted P-loop ATPase/GTPase